MKSIHVLKAGNAFHFAQQHVRKGQRIPPICCCFTTQQSVIGVPVWALMPFAYESRVAAFVRKVALMRGGFIKDIEAVMEERICVLPRTALPLDTPIVGK